MLQRKAHENYQNLPEEEKTKKSEYASNRYRRLFIENELSEKKKKENVNMHVMYTIIFLEKIMQKV